MKRIMNQSHCQLHFRTSATRLFIIALLSLSGNVYAQNKADSLKSTTYRIDQATGEFQIDSVSIPYDTIPKIQNYIFQYGFGAAIPISDFRSSDAANNFAGYALPGFSLSTGVFVGFDETSEAGWYFGAAYSNFSKSHVFADSLAAALDAFEPEPVEGVETEPAGVTLGPDYRPRYDMLSLRTGLAFEGSDKRVSAYGGLILSLNFIRMNNIPLRGNIPAGMRSAQNQFQVPTIITTGVSASFGLRFQQQFSVGVAWHYLGSPDLTFERPENGSAPPVVFQDISMQRRIHFLEVRIGYGIATRAGWKTP